MKSFKLPKLCDGTTGFIDSHGVRICTGARMGRRDSIPEDYKTVKKLRLVRVRLIDWCYDEGGAYWGCGAPLYRAFGYSDTEKAEVFFRASDRDDAKVQANAAFPNAKFFR